MDYALTVNCGITVSPPGASAGFSGDTLQPDTDHYRRDLPYGYVVTTGSLPPGLVLAPYTGVLSGTPTNDGTFTFTVTVWDHTYCFTDKDYSPHDLSGLPSIDAITGEPSGRDRRGRPTPRALTPRAGTGPYTYAVTGGALPTELTLAEDGQIAGTASNTGSFYFTVTATDAHQCTGSKSYTLIMNSPCPTITLSPPAFREE